MNELDLTHNNGIKLPYFSVSTVNSFIENRFGFYQSKIKMTPFNGNQFMARGTAVEHGVNTWLEKRDHPDLLSVTLAKFDEECVKAGLSKIQVEDFRDTIQGLLDVALGFYKNEFSETGALTQQKIACKLDGVDRDYLGYLDYLQFDKAVRDSKVVNKTPSKLKQAYILQGALYNKATGLPVFFDFFVDNKKPIHKAIQIKEEEIAYGISYLTAASKVLEELQECDNPKRIIELMSFPNLEAFYSDGEAHAAAKMWEIEGFLAMKKCQAKD